MTSHEIALKFAEAFQNNYPKKPLLEMMEDLRKEIELYAKDSAEKTWEAAMKRAIHILEPTEKIVPDKETFMRELFKPVTI